MVCTSFPLAHFHQIKTNPEAPKIQKANLRIQRVLDEVAIALLFDQPGSIASGKKETVAQQSAVIFHKALCSTPKAQIYLSGFNDVPIVIKGHYYLTLATVLRRIPLALKAKGGTDFPLALKVAINLLEEFTVHKKIIFILTDGDVTGSDDPVELVNEASQKNINVFIIAVEGSDYLELVSKFGKTKVIKIDHILELPLQIKKMVIASLKNQRIKKLEHLKIKKQY
ncbi:MAG: VWA domain-containing protein [Candidatus Hodarchaeota archaeon]